MIKLINLNIIIIKASVAMMTLTLINCFKINSVNYALNFIIFLKVYGLNCNTGIKLHKIKVRT